MTKKTVAASKRKSRSILSLGECTTLRQLCNYRIDKLKDNIDNAAGSTYPAIWDAEIARIGALFEKLTGYPLDRE